jgi:hypothetical protein
MKGKSGAIYPSGASSQLMTVVNVENSIKISKIPGIGRPKRGAARLFLAAGCRRCEFKGIEPSVEAGYSVAEQGYLSLCRKLVG